MPRLSHKISRLLNVLAIALTFIALLSVIWIIVPAPDYRVWLFSVAVGEWSLWFSALALIGMILGLIVRAAVEKNKLRVASLIIGSMAFIISLYPLFSTLPIASEQGVSFSLKRYFSGFNSSKTQTQNFITYTFAQIDGKDLRLDVYSPTNETANNGASVIVVHGGSWNGGTRNDFPQWNGWLAENGFTVFDVDYRLAPQPNYLTATGDVKCAVAWVKEHAAEFKVSPERIALLGRSAGAHLALLAAYSADDAHLPATCADKETSENIRAVVSFYAPVDLLWSYDNPANRFVINGPVTLARFLGGSPHESAELHERFILASPTAHVKENTPPTLLIHGGQDQLVRSDNMTRLAEKLNEAGVPHKTLFIAYAQHGFDYNFNGFGSQISQAAILEFLHENTQAK
ncbi:MAG: alpha/beta hydrolase [Acidobacteriota bacterium]|nr:alpha/beta hydrolase [Acidobacteriota bacterium]